MKSKRFLSKSPAHSARIPMLLKLFPNAKFIYIARNPYFIYSSNITHFSSTFETLSFQRISKEELSANVLASYKKIIIDHYEQQKQLIPEGNLLEREFDISTSLLNMSMSQPEHVLQHKEARKYR